MVGAPDVKVVNVTKDAIWVRDASLVGLGNLRKPKPSDALALAVDTGRGLGHVVLPKVKVPREQQQDKYVREKEIDPAKYYPTDVNRDLVLAMPTTLNMVEGMVQKKIKAKVKSLKAKLTKSHE